MKNYFKRKLGFKVIIIGISLMLTMFSPIIAANNPEILINEKISKKLTDSKGKIDIMITTNSLNDVKSVAQIIKSKGGEISFIQDKGVPRIWAKFDSSMINEITNIPEIYYIEPDLEEIDFLDLITTNTYMGMDAAQIGGFTGDGIMGEVQDSGCEMTHPDFNVDYYDGPVSIGSHGTCTYGIVFSLGTNDMKAQGTLYDAISVFADYDAQTQYNSVDRLWDGTFSSGNAGQNGFFQSNSWGHMSSSGGIYTSYANEADQACYDYPKLLVLWAAGNSNYGVFKGSLSYEAASKNGLTIGAVYHKNTANMADDEWLNGFPGSTPSQGPCADDRQKPDLVGPFDWIYCTDMVGGNGYASGDYYNDFGGTSGSTPIVAGIAGQTYEMYIENHFGNNPGGNIPSSAMIKAILIADAYQYSLTDSDRDSQGWGSADAEQIYTLGSNYHVLKDDQSVAEGGSWSQVVQSDGSKPLKITLTWNDPAAPGTTGNGRALRNNLDLKITGPGGTTWYGNNGLYTNLWSTSGTGTNHWTINNNQWDDLNNVENVFIQNPTSGSYTIEVFGRSGDMVSSPQNFAVAAAGAYEGNQPPTCTLTATPSSGEAPLTTTFSMSASDLDGSIANWELDVENDGIPEDSGIGNPPATQQHTYTNPGTYTAELTVWDNEGAPGYDTTIVDVLGPNNPPDTPTNPNPNDEATGVDLSPTIQVDVNDIDGDTITVNFYEEGGGLIGTDTVVGSGTAQTIWNNANQYLTTYYWYTVADDGKESTSSYPPAWSFTTKEVQPEYFYANQDIPVQNGGIKGTYQDTFDSDNIREQISERQSGGKPSNRHSYLEHKWIIPVTGGLESYIFYIEAHHSLNTEDDDFIFEYSTNDVNYNPMVTVTKTSDDNNYQMFSLPTSISGDIYIRVKDTDQTRGNRVLDTIYIDHMYILGSGTPPPNRAPDKPIDPDPSDGATGVDVNPTLSVYVYDLDGDAMDVTFYDQNNDLIGTDTGVSSGSRASAPWSGLDFETTYAWYAIADDGEYTNTSITWYFTTRSDTPTGGMYVWDISWKSAGPNLKSTVTIRRDSDNDGIAEASDELVVDATVDYTLTHESSDFRSYSDVTDSDGQVTFQWSKAPRGQYEGLVADISHSSHIYDSLLDEDNPDYHTH